MIIIVTYFLFQKCPPKKGFIRGVSYLTGYLVGKLDGTKCQFTYVSQSDPKGMNPLTKCQFTYVSQSDPKGKNPLTKCQFTYVSQSDPKGKNPLTKCQFTYVSQSDPKGKNPLSARIKYSVTCLNRTCLGPAFVFKIDRSLV
jgi:hypothetical protein